MGYKPEMLLTKITIFGIVSFFFMSGFITVSYAAENETDSCAGVTCNPSSLACPDGYTATCTNTCSAGTCSSCSPDCSAHQAVDKCAGVTCHPYTLTCPDTFVASCMPACEPVVGQCNTCNPDCSAHQGQQQACAQVITYAVDGAGHCQQFSNSCLPPGWTQVGSCPATAQCPARIEIKLSQDVYKLGDKGVLTVNAYAPDGTSLSGTTYTVKIYVNGVLQSQNRGTTPYTSSGDVSSGSPAGTYVFDLYTDVPNCPSVSSSAKALFETGGTCGDKICQYNENNNICPADCQASTQVCAQVITPAKNPLTGECKEFSTPCEVPQGWERVSSCGASVSTGACPLYAEPPCQGYKVSAGRDANGCQLPVTCCGDRVCSGSENSMNCKDDCSGGGAINCANTVVCLSGDGCCPPGCNGQIDKDCGGTQLPTGQRCPDGTTVKCSYVGNDYICDPCPIQQQNIQQGCRQESDTTTGIVRMICNQICPEQQEVIDAQMSAAKQKCVSQNGNPLQRVDGRGCNYIDCQFGTATYATPISINPVYCPSPQQIDEAVSKCKSMGIEPLFSFEGNCKVVKCMEQQSKGCDYPPEEEWTRMKAICNPKGLAAIKEFDSNGCQVIRCGGQGECSKDPPKEAFEKCRADGGEMIIKRDPNGCAFSRCIMRGDERDIYVEDIKEMPESTELLSIAFKLEELKMTLDQLSKKTDDIAEYYKSVGSPEENRFRRVSGMFQTAKDKVDEIKTKLSSRIKDLTKDDLMEVKSDIKYIKDVVLKDIVYFMLSNSDEVKAVVMQSKVEQVGSIGKEGDCGSDGGCFDRAFRVCKPVIFKPTGPPPGEQGEGPPPGEEPDIYIVGLEGDSCIVKIMLTQGGPPAGMIPGVNPPYEMKCRIRDYALGAQNLGPQMFQKYCEGNLLKLIQMGNSGGEKQYRTQEPMQTQTTQTSSVSGGGGGTATTTGPCSGCLNNGICDVGECKDCKDCYGK